MYKTVMFDFDGTLFDTSEGIFNCVRYAAEAFGLETGDDKSLRMFVGPPLSQSIRKYFGVSEARSRELTEKYRERYGSVGMYECAPYPGIREMLAALREAGVKTLVATGKPTPFTEKIIARMGMTELFDGVLGSELDGTRERKSEVIAELMLRHGGENCVMVGDRYTDADGAAACGIPCIGVSWGFADPGELEAHGVTAVARTPQELLEMLTRPDYN